MKKIRDKIYTYDYSAKIMPGVRFPVRSTLLELENDELMIISPGPFKSEEIRDFTSRYRQVHCVAPNAVHHLYLKRFHETFPETPIYGPQTLLKKQPWLAGKLQSLELLKENLSGQVSLFPILGNKFLDETVFYIPSSKTLIVTDLFFNMRDPMPFGQKCILSLVGARNKIAQSGLVKMTTKDKQAYRSSVATLSELDCDRILVGHGHILETKEDIQRAFEVAKN